MQVLDCKYSQLRARSSRCEQIGRTGGVARLLARHCELLLATASKFSREASEAVLTALFCSSHLVRCHLGPVSLHAFFYTNKLLISRPQGIGFQNVSME
jgi:hypothetical protein